MKSNNTYKTSQIIDMLDSVTERIDDIEKLLISKHSKVEDWTTAGLTEEEKEVKKEWVCKVCGKSTFETDYDYIVNPKLCLGCALTEEFKRENIKEQHHKTDEKYARESEACGTQQPTDKYIKRLSDSWSGAFDAMKETQIKKPNTSEDVFWTRVSNGIRRLLKSPWEK